MKEKKISFENKEGLKLAGVLHIPSKQTKKAVIISHSFTGNKEEPLIVLTARELCKHGFCVLRFDFSGCGESKGRFEDITPSRLSEDLKSAVRYMLKGHSRIGLVGESMGGMTVILTAGKFREIKAMVLWCPLVFPEKTLSSYFDRHSKDWRKEIKKGVIVIEKNRKKFRIGKQLWDEARKTDVIKAASSLGIRTMILHGDSDETVPYTDSWELLKAMKNAKLEVIRGAGHGFRKEEDTRIAVEMTLGWFEEYL